MSEHGNLVVLAAGGTGGHVFPAEALAAELLDRGCGLALVTDDRGGAFGGTLSQVETYRVRAGGLAGKSLMGRLRSIPELALGTLQARSLLKELKPEAVIGFGGYASIPAMMAATMGGYRAAIHEQNAVLGRANRLLAKRVARIATSFASVKGLPKDAERKVVHTGMPVRPAVHAVRDAAYASFGAEGEINVLILGGSQGARVLSEVTPKALTNLSPELRARLRVTQQCRPEDLEAVRAVYGEANVQADLASFFDDVPDRLAKCHLLIGRAGASTVAEATTVGRPSILVPYPYATDDHQSANAHALDDVGGGWLTPQDAFTPESLADRLECLFTGPATLEKAAACARAVGRPDAASALADVVFELLGANGEPAPDERRAAA